MKFTILFTLFLVHALIGAFVLYLTSFRNRLGHVTADDIVVNKGVHSKIMTTNELTVSGTGMFAKTNSNAPAIIIAKTPDDIVKKNEMAQNQSLLSQVSSIFIEEKQGSGGVGIGINLNSGGAEGLTVQASPTRSGSYPQDTNAMVVGKGVVHAVTNLNDIENSGSSASGS